MDPGNTPIGRLVLSPITVFFLLSLSQLSLFLSHALPLLAWTPMDAYQDRLPGQSHRQS